MLGSACQESGNLSAADLSPSEANVMEQSASTTALLPIGATGEAAAAPTAVHRKLGAAGILNPGDMQVIDELLAHRSTSPAGSMLISERQLESEAQVLLSGWAFRFRVFEDGR